MVTPDRERIATPDGDFLDLDRASRGHSRVVVLSHGLEGSSRQTYVQGMAHALLRRGWDAVAWNCRGCSGELNHCLRFYHSGATEDLQVVLQHVLASGRYARVALVGFSLGGNMTLKYLGEQGDAIDPRVVGAVAFSVPCDLASSSVRLAAWGNQVYMRRFLRTMKRKVREKAARFPGRINLTGLDTMRTFAAFDGGITAPLHGFTDAEDYWRRASSRPWLARIRVPTLLVNARDDPFLGDACFPMQEAELNQFLHLETPAAGGHVGFVTFDGAGEYWSEKRAATFLESVAPHPAKARASPSS